MHCLDTAAAIATIIGAAVTAVGVVAAVVGICVAKKIFQRNTTLQTEIFILSAYKDYMNTMYSGASDECKNNAKTRFLMAIDLHCKYVINGHLDGKLSADNLNFYGSA